uniref:Protein kinase domain-containing protein n=1 Tax=Amphilophus citrinellus TaxID=61819 RepID=A0A3Q0R3F4_AMPCI
MLGKPEEQSLVLSQQPTRCQSKSPHTIDCSVKNPVELPEKTPVNMPVNTPAFLPNDLDIGEGTILGNSYKVEKFLGQGVFGFVTKCINTQTNKAVAVKVNKNDPKILQQAKLEMFMLEQLQCLDPESCNIVRWNSIFFYFLDRERICLNFELLDQSLFDYTKDRNFQPLPISELSSMGIVHTDLKTDNLMIVDRRQSPIKVKIIDFGLACLVSSLTPDVTVQPIFYRAPEVMLNAPFNEAIDMWSLGLIAAELAIGRPLYPGKMEIDVFRFITLTQGQPPDHVLDHGFSFTPPLVQFPLLCFTYMYEIWYTYVKYPDEQKRPQGPVA